MDKDLQQHLGELRDELRSTAGAHREGVKKNIRNHIKSTEQRLDQEPNLPTQVRHNLQVYIEELTRLLQDA